MRRLVCAVAFALALEACNPILDNRASVYPPVAGKFVLRWAPEQAGADVVLVLLDGNEVGKAAPSAGSFQVDLDSKAYPNGLHRLRLEARTTAGALLQTLEHAIYIQN